MKYSDILLDNHKKDAWVRRNVWSASKFLGLGIVISVLLYLGTEHQNEKLESLAKHGQRTRATVTRDDGKFTHYKYEVDGRSYEWNVRSLGTLVGDQVDIIYAPEHPELNRPGTDPEVVANEAMENRDFLRKLLFGINAVFVLLALRAPFVQRVMQKRDLQDVNAPLLTPDFLGRGVALLVLLLVLGGNFSPEIAAVHEKAFGAQILGAPTKYGVAVVEFILFFPFFFVFPQIMRIKAEEEFTSTPGMLLFLLFGDKDKLSLKRSRLVVIAGGIYFFAIVAAWCVFAGLNSL